MSAHYVTSMWGKCDGSDIVFTPVKAPTLWKCNVPIDLTDGIYIVEIFGRLNSGGIIFTTAVLYLSDSTCVNFELKDSDYIFYALDDDISFVASGEDISFVPERCTFSHGR